MPHLQQSVQEDFGKRSIAPLDNPQPKGSNSSVAVVSSGS